MELVCCGTGTSFVGEDIHRRLFFPSQILNQLRIWQKEKARKGAKYEPVQVKKLILESVTRICGHRVFRILDPSIGNTKVSPVRLGLSPSVCNMAKSSPEH